MRSMTFEAGGKTHEMKATFQASVELANKVGDPLMIAREAAMEAAMQDRLLPYKPSFAFTIENVPVILEIGLRAAGSKLKTREIEDLVFDMGFAEGQELASNYLALIITPTPADQRDSDKVSTGEK